MLSADPFEPTNLQNYNRYSYVTNNPLSVTDPSGFFFKKFAQAIITIALVNTQQYRAVPLVAVGFGAWRF